MIQWCHCPLVPPSSPHWEASDKNLSVLRGRCSIIVADMLVTNETYAFGWFDDDSNSGWVTVYRENLGGGRFVCPEPLHPFCVANPGTGFPEWSFPADFTSDMKQAIIRDMPFPEQHAASAIRTGPLKLTLACPLCEEGIMPHSTYCPGMLTIQRGSEFNNLVTQLENNL